MYFFFFENSNSILKDGKYFIYNLDLEMVHGSDLRKQVGFDGVDEDVPAAGVDDVKVGALLEDLLGGKGDWIL